LIFKRENQCYGDTEQKEVQNSQEFFEIKNNGIRKEVKK